MPGRYPESSQGNNVDWLVDKVARVASKQEGLAGELNGARATLADLKREQDGLVAEGLSLKNNVTKMTNEVTSVTAEHYNIVRELGSKQDHLNNKILCCGTMPQSWRTSWQG
jgi:hypothetical protein